MFLGCLNFISILAANKFDDDLFTIYDEIEDDFLFLENEIENDWLESIYDDEYDVDSGGKTTSQRLNMSASSSTVEKCTCLP